VEDAAWLAYRKAAHAFLGAAEAFANSLERRLPDEAALWVAESLYSYLPDCPAGAEEAAKALDRVRNQLRAAARLAEEAQGHRPRLPAGDLAFRYAAEEIHDRVNQAGRLLPAHH
jgi:hypothetical protein